MQGVFAFGGKVVKPPLVVRQEAEKIFINEMQMYPPVEVEESPDLTKLGIEGVFSATEKASPLGNNNEARVMLSGDILLGGWKGSDVLMVCEKTKAKRIYDGVTKQKFRGGGQNERV